MVNWRTNKKTSSAKHIQRNIHKLRETATKIYQMKHMETKENISRGLICKYVEIKIGYKQSATKHTHNENICYNNEIVIIETNNST